MNFGFASPNYAYLLFLLPLIALFKIWADWKSRQALESFASSSRLRAALLGGPSAVWASVHFGLQLLGVGFIILALTRPQYGDDEKDLEQTGRNIFIAIDTSKSMLAQDLPPSRLERARLAAQDLLEKLRGDRVGIIAFAGRAFLQAPLTTDQEALIDTIQAIDHTSIPRGGSSLASAIELAVETAAKSRGIRHGLVVFTDGQETDDAAIEAAKRAAEMNLIILPVGVGTQDGTFIPDPDALNDSDYIRDENNNVVKTRLESALLHEIARITGGEYVELSSQPLTKFTVDRVMANLDRHKDGSHHLSRPIERYQWPLGAGIICLIMSQLLRPPSRRAERTAALPVDPKATVHQHPPAHTPVAARVALLFLGVLMLPLSAHAKVDPGVQAARDHYREGRFKEARDAYSKMLQSKEPPAPLDELYYGLGAAELQLQQYNVASKSFSDALKSDRVEYQREAHRGLGTTLYSQGEASLKAFDLEATIKSWTDSRDHYDSALQRAAEGSDEHRELSENRAFVQKRLDAVKRLDAEMKKRAKKEREEREKQKREKKEQEGEGGEGEPEEEQEGEGEQQSPPKDQDGNEGKERKKKTDALQKEQEGVLEGELRAAEPGDPGSETKSDAADPDNMRNDATGFTPQEARTQLKNYSDENKSRSNQYLIRPGRPAGGKDY